MTLKKTLTAALASAALMTLATAAQAEVKMKLEPYVTGLTSPLAMVSPPNDPRKFVIEQDGRVRLIDADGKLNPNPVLDIRSLMVKQFADFDERGLLGLTFHPDFANNGKFYIAYSAVLDYDSDLGKQFWWDHSNVVAEYTMAADDPNVAAAPSVADPNSGRIIHKLDWPQFNHNGHWIDFGSDGMLYISTGDGGYANDWGIGHNVTEGNGQDMTSKHGKILRIDVNKSEFGMPYGIPEDNPFTGDSNTPGEIWAAGLRNPWRCSFDMGGDNELFCADVQQNSFEEVDIVQAGANLGWRKMEASHCFDYQKPDDHPTDCDKSQYVLPILEYKNCTAQPDGCLGISVTGGYVYRGSHEAWQGKYIFGDWSKNFAERNGQIFVGTKGDDGNWSMEVATVEGTTDGKTPYILAFAQDSDGEVYALTSVTTGPNGKLDTIYKLVPAE